ncbi:hypothetical protein QAD02_020166 [Eretmocerus hayati]|uniref:Uncharacterized protein n=1 Tax=Eretmocerus hayati TaxID=131215 RepID=A0ACC2PM52_9HYME|nr:hypothetical protein QAD02_020166 [Eretmocerus hayati]
MILDAGLSKCAKRKELTEDIPRYADICIEALILNQQVVANLIKDEIGRDDFFVQYQNMLGASISVIASLLDFLTELLPTLGLVEENRKEITHALGKIFKID